MYEWTVEFTRDAEKELDKFPRELRAKIERTIDLIKVHGLTKMIPPYVKHIRGKIWEIRASGKNVIGRAMYVTVTGKKVVILSAFIKKTQTTPQKEIDKAIKRAKEIEDG